MTGEGGESSRNTNFNYLLEENGMSVNSDAVARTVYYKYFDPKEVCVTDGVLNRELIPIETITPDSNSFEQKCLTFVYPFGATLNVQPPAIPLLSSGTLAYPFNRPLAAACQPSKNSGKILAIGSAQIFGDSYIGKEENGKLCDVFLQLLTTNDKIILNLADSNEPDVNYNSYTRYQTIITCPMSPN
jgi:intraflagellar transport protein 52